MYEEYFRLAAQPFKLNPDPKFFFGSRSHNKAMAYLHYGLRQAEGFIVITGEIGAGKSMLISHLLDQLDRSRIAAAHLLTPNLRSEDLLSHILSAFRVEAAGDGTTAPLEAFEDFLFDQLNHGRRVLLIVDEAQNLPSETLEELRILSNMDYDGTPLFQVFLVGQPDFRPKLAGPNMEQLRQRIIASYHLEPLSHDETKNYIEHRLAVVGWNDDPAFSENAFSAIFEESGGVPRKINKLCNRILLYCSLEEIHEINQSVVRSVSADMAEENVAVTEPVRDESAVRKEAAPELNDQHRAVETPKQVERNAQASEHDHAQHQSAVEKNGSLPPVVVPFNAVRKVSAEEVIEKEIDETPKAKQKAERERKNGAGAKGKKMTVKDKSDKVDAVKNKSEKPENQASTDISTLSVLDRLRLQRQSNAKTEESPEPATIKDVAKAIAAVDEGTLHELDHDDGEAEIEGPDFQDDLKGWRQAVSKTLNETRDELKGAHSTMIRLRRNLNETDKKRREKVGKISSNLARAETLLSELRD